MQATEDLKHEHEAILLVLDLAENMIEQVDPSRKDLRDLIAFFGEFIDHCHHAKEKDMLFRDLKRKEIESLPELTQSLEREHEEGRRLVSRMRTALDNGPDTGPLEAEFIQTLDQYRELLEVHIDKENNRLFVIADQLLGEADQQTLKQAFDRHEEEEMGHGRHEQFHAMIDHWRKIYG